MNVFQKAWNDLPPAPPPPTELDLAIAKIRGWTWNDECARSPSGSKYDRQRPDHWWWCPRYSTDIAAAWDAFEGMPFIPENDITMPRIKLEHHLAILRNPNGDWCAGWLWQTESGQMRWYGRWLGIGETAAEAMCQARLLAAQTREVGRMPCGA